jgi:hypothetical protein
MVDKNSPDRPSVWGMKYFRLRLATGVCISVFRSYSCTWSPFSMIVLLWASFIVVLVKCPGSRIISESRLGDYLVVTRIFLWPTENSCSSGAEERWDNIRAAADTAVWAAGVSQCCHFTGSRVTHTCRRYWYERLLLLASNPLYYCIPCNSSMYKERVTILRGYFWRRTM